MNQAKKREITKLVNSQSDVKANLNLFVKSNSLYKKMINKNLDKMTEDQVKKLDRDTDKLNEKVAKHYKAVLDFLVKKGVSLKDAHNYIMSKSK